jgi:hypothetical protein
MSEDLHRIVGGLEAKQDAILAMLKEDRAAAKEVRESLISRVSALEKMRDELKWTIKGIMLAGSFIGAAIASVVMLFWKWVTG